MRVVDIEIIHWVKKKFIVITITSKLRKTFFVQKIVSPLLAISLKKKNLRDRFYQCCMHEPDLELDVIVGSQK